MTSSAKAARVLRMPSIRWGAPGRVRLPLATKLILSFLLVIVFVSLVFIVVGVQLIGNRIVSEAQEKVRYDLNSAQVMYSTKLSNVNDVVRFAADRAILMNYLLSGDVQLATSELVIVKQREKLDVLTVTDKSGKVLLRTSNLTLVGDDESQNPLVSRVLKTKEPVAATMIVPPDELQKESPALANQAYFQFIDTPMARPTKETEETSGMMLEAAAPIFDLQNNFLGIVYGGILLNRNYELVDQIKQTVYQDLKYDGKDIGTATIFQDDLRISTNVRNDNNSRAVGTRVSEEVYNQVVLKGEPYFGRAYVVNNWYITAYEPIRSLDNQIIGILYVGILEQKYTDLERETILVFLGITLAGVLAAMTLSYFLSGTISQSINKLATASREIAHGNLDTRVEIRSNDELQELADAFNFMTTALKKRDEQLKEFTTLKIMESERLAMIGQLAANVAHEINNPLQGIVAYSHLLLEKMPADGPTKPYVQKITNQANRCTQIIRGLLDFSRQRKPQKTRSDVNQLLVECVSLIENQALFQNVQIVKDFSKLPEVVVDPSQIQQVFMNMIINAAEAMDGNGTLTLTTRFFTAERSVGVEFADTGHGISEKNIERIFDPFFTTKDVGHGTGLGLAISYGIVKEHRGTISVESKIGKGTTFCIKLPLIANGESGEHGNQAQDTHY
jgi:two-component system, NtrC family, sensor kinase